RASRALYRPRLYQRLCRGEARRARPLPRSHRRPRIPLVSVSAVARGLLAWYDRHRRSLPWRARPGERPDPFRVWLSEIMLKQTTVVTVGPYFQSFFARWPNVQALAA